MDREVTGRTLTALLAALALLSGCAGSSMFVSYPHRIDPYLSAVSAGQPIAIDRTLRSEARGSDGVLYRMERGRLAQLQGDYAASRVEFARAIAAVRDADERAVVSVRDTGDEVASWLLNDNARRYEPQGYERVFLHHYQALNYLFAGDLEGAGVEVRGANAEQEAARWRHADEIETANAAAREKRVGAGRARSLEERFSVMDAAAEQAANSFQNACTFYLSGIVYEAMGEPNDAYIDYRKALGIFPNNRYLQLDALRLAETLGMQEDLDEMRTRFRVPEGATFSKREPGSGELVVLYEDGFVPRKEEVKFPVPLPGGGFGAVAFPIYRYAWSPPAPLHVGRHNIVTLSTEPIAYVDAMAVRALKEEIPGIIVRHLIRTGGKSVAAAAATRSDRNVGQLAGVAVGIWNIVSENADLRSWLSLPRDAQMLRATMPAGRQLLSLRSDDGGTTDKVEVEIVRGKITLLHVARTGATWHVRQAVLGRKPATVAAGPVR
jgi:hypothetical protein